MGLTWGTQAGTTGLVSARSGGGQAYKPVPGPQLNSGTEETPIYRCPKQMETGMSEEKVSWLLVKGPSPTLGPTLPSLGSSCVSSRP